MAGANSPEGRGSRALDDAHTRDSRPMQTTLGKPFVLGVDGGGTWTRCAVVSLEGCVLGQGDSGPSNYLRVGAEAATESVLGAVAEAVRKAGVELPAAVACVCLAGVGRPDDHVTMLPRLSGLAAEVVLETDATGALAGAHALEPGIVVIAGTGAIAYGKGASGEIVRCDGWGPILGDEGGGYWIGSEVLRAVVRAADGRSEATALTPAVLAHLGLEAPSQLVNHFPWGRFEATEVAELAEVCSRVAAEGDWIAAGILRRSGAKLAESCVVVARLIADGTRPRIAVTGSVFSDRTVREEFGRAVAAALPEADIGECRFAPVLGAALLALQAGGTQVTPAVLANLARSSSPSRGPAGT